MRNILKHLKNKKGYIGELIFVMLLVIGLLAVSLSFFFQTTNEADRLTQTAMKRIEESSKLNTETTSDKKDLNKTVTNEVIPETKDSSNESKEKIKEELKTELKQEIESETKEKPTEEKHNIFYDINIQVISEIIGTIIISIFVYIWRKTRKNKIKEKELIN